MIGLLRQLLAAILSIILAAPLCASNYDPVGNRRVAQTINLKMILGAAYADFACAGFDFSP